MDEVVTEREPLAVGVRLRPGGAVHPFDPGSLVLFPADRVIVEADQGPLLGTVVGVMPRRRRAPLRRILKKADVRDLAREDRALQREREQYRAVLDVARERGVPAKLVKIDGSADGGRLTVFFAAEERIDLRDLGRGLADALRTRVEVKQIGAREEARVTGGIGACGRELCCASWLREFEAVTVKMVKAQSLALNPTKLAGQCGRLKCCLRYEYQTYEELRRTLPRVGARAQSVKGNGKVVRQNALAQTVVLLREDDGVETEVTLQDLVEQRPPA